MEVSNSKFNAVHPKKESKGRNVGASLLAAGAASVVPTVSMPAGIAIVKKMQKVGDLPEHKINILHQKAEEAIKMAGLDKFGVKIEYLKQPKFKKPFIQVLSNPIAMIEQGMNAAFLNSPAGFFKKNTILMPEKGISFAAFHEIGHAMNYNLSKIGKLLQKMRMPGMFAAGAIGLFGAFTKTSKPQDGKELTKWQKFKNFVRDNAGKLSFAAMVPMLAEEAMATIKGQKLAKKLLSPKMAKTVAKGNAIAYLSYLASAAALGLSSLAAVKVKDYFVDKKETKQANK